MSEIELDNLALLGHSDDDSDAGSDDGTGDAARPGGGGASADAARDRDTWRNLSAFWCLGLLNNTAYVIMNAGAKEISPGAVGLVYVANVAPSLITKASLPYWADRVGYRARVHVCAVLMVMAFLLVGFGQSLGVQLLGVACCAAQSGLGEASMLGMTSRYHTTSTLTAWSSGTGFAGVFGYAWVTILHSMLEIPLPTVVLAANILVVAWLATFHLHLSPPRYPAPADVDAATASAYNDEREGDEDANYVTAATAAGLAVNKDQGEARERFKFIMSLWPFVVPLIVVYFSEYAIQAGAWAAIGFPIHSESERKKFYLYSNWTYQAGVFVSRSSGMLYQAGFPALWAMPAVQAGLLIFFCLDSIQHFWWDWSLLIVCFATGLIGGFVYVNAFTLIKQKVRADRVELALSAASIGDSLGIMMSDVSAIFIQGCLFRWNGIAGARYLCECCASLPDGLNITDT